MTMTTMISMTTMTMATIKIMATVMTMATMRMLEVLHKQVGESSILKAHQPPGTL